MQYIYEKIFLMKIIENRGHHIEFELKNPKVEKYFMKWKEFEIGILTVDYLP